MPIQLRAAASTILLAVATYLSVSVAALAQGDSTFTVNPAAVSDSTHVSIPRIAIVGAATAGAFVYGHVLQSNLWWKGERSEFHFEWEHDWRYALGADKLGHAWFPYIVADTYDRLFLWCGLDSSAAVWSASSLALTYQTYVEVRDGFSREWGFSLGDFAADVAGAALPLVQHYVPVANAVNLKMSFYPSDEMRAGLHRAIIDDYESTYHWISFRMKRIVPKDWRRAYPGVIDLALGDRVVDLDGTGGGSHEIFLALDWNFDEIPLRGWAWEVLRTIVRHYHLPAPSVRIYPWPARFGILF